MIRPDTCGPRVLTRQWVVAPLLALTTVTTVPIGGSFMAHVPVVVSHHEACPVNTVWGLGAAVVVVATTLALTTGLLVTDVARVAAVTGATAREVVVVGAVVVVEEEVDDEVDEVGRSSAPAEDDEEPSGSISGTTIMAAHKNMKKTIFLIRLCAGLRTPPS